MADERDANLSRQYRSLEPLEPTADLDHAILSAARRAANRGQRRQRWYYPLAAAAVLVLAVALTLQLERRPPQPEAPSQVSQGPVTQAPAPEPGPAAEPATAPRPQPAPARADETKPAAQAPRPAQPARGSPPARPAASAAPAAKPAPLTLPPSAPGVAAQSAMRAPTQEGAVARAAPEKPEPWLERIAELRSRGRHEEADRQLAEFRRAYPNYPLSEIMRERVEGR
jgi:hypothetical protein